MSRYNTRKERWIKRLLPESQKASYQKKIDEKNISNWEKSGRPMPPPHIVKVRTVERFQAKTAYKTLVETGTFMGDMIEAQLGNFDKIYSIELSEKYWKDAKEKFKSQPKVKLLQGDSGKVLHELQSELKEPAIFWLDGHYSGADTAKGEKISPIYEELEAIFKSPIAHCVLIDDARLFNGTDDYPALDDLKAFIVKKRPKAEIAVDSDTISVLY
jgi:hypothetical protein